MFYASYRSHQSDTCCVSPQQFVYFESDDAARVFVVFVVFRSQVSFPHFHIRHPHCFLLHCFFSPRWIPPCKLDVLVMENITILLFDNEMHALLIHLTENRAIYWIHLPSEKLWVISRTTPSIIL